MTKKEIDRIIFALLKERMLPNQGIQIPEPPKQEFIFDFQDIKLKHEVTLN